MLLNIECFIISPYDLGLPCLRSLYEFSYWHFAALLQVRVKDCGEVWTCFLPAQAQCGSSESFEWGLGWCNLRGVCVCSSDPKSTAMRSTEDTPREHLDHQHHFTTGKGFVGGQGSGKLHDVKWAMV